MKIGFVGLGKMGLPMATNLLKAGHAITAFNRNKAAVSKLWAPGVTAARSPKEVGMSSDFVLLSLPTLEAIREVVLGDEGLAEVFGPEGWSSTQAPPTPSQSAACRRSSGRKE